MTGVTAIGVNDDLAAGQACIALGAPHHKFSGGIHQIPGGSPVGLEGEIGSGRFHDMGPKILCDAIPDPLLVTDAGHLGGVLGGDQDGVDGDGSVVLIDDADLGFPVRQQVVEGAGMANLGQTFGEPRRAVPPSDCPRLCPCA